MTRIAHIANICWLSPYDRGVKKALLVSGDPAIYTDGELAMLSRYTDTCQQYHLHHFGGVDGCTNFIEIEKHVRGEGRVSWHRKRNTWNQGEMWSGSLSEAISVMERGRARPTGFALTRDFIASLPGKYGERGIQAERLDNHEIIELNTVDINIIANTMAEMITMVNSALIERALPIETPLLREDASPSEIVRAWQARVRRYDGS